MSPKRPLLPPPSQTNEFQNCGKLPFAMLRMLMCMVRLSALFFVESGVVYPANP
jgi:hypothetical protein